MSSKIKRFFISLFLTIIISIYIAFGCYVLDIIHWKLRDSNIFVQMFGSLLVIGVFCLPLTINLIKKYKDGGE
jgi:hypothetical protein